MTTDYRWDRASGLPQLLDDGTTSAVRAGSMTAEVDNATDDHAWDLTDALGSVRAQTDDTAAVTGTADWDVWGNASAGNAGLFGWAGEQSDPETGLSFLRARYYSPVFGQFLSADPLGAGSGTQRSAYAFAMNNPATLGDPSGLSPSGGGIAGAFWYLAYVFECYTVGECRYGRRHAAGDPEPIREATPSLIGGNPGRIQVPVPPVPVPGTRADGACPGGETKCDLTPAGTTGTCQFGAACDPFHPSTGWSRGSGDPHYAGCVGWSGNSIRPWGEGLFGFSSMRYYTVCEMISDLKNIGLFWKLIQLAGEAGDITIGVDAGGWPLNETILALLQILSLPFSLLQMLAGPDTANRLEAAKCSSGNGVVVITVDDRLAWDFKRHFYGNDFYYGEFPNPDLYKYGSHYVPQFGPAGGWPCPD